MTVRGPEVFRRLETIRNPVKLAPVNAATMAMLDRALEPISQSLNLESARALVQASADPSLQERVSQLAEKCERGELSDAERDEYETYVQVGNLLSILQAKARLFLRAR